MDLERLATNAKEREEWALLELWEAVKRFARQQALKYLQRGDNAARIELDDLMQAGFIAMFPAIDYYKPGAGAGFLTIYDYFLKRGFAEAGGHRSAKRDAVMYAESLDLPAYDDEPDGDKEIDLLRDPCGEYAFLLVEYDDFIDYCHNLIIAAMQSLTPEQKKRIYQYYFQRKSLASIAGEPEAREKVRACIDRGLRHMKHGKYNRQLREALQGFEDFRELETDIRRDELQALQKQA